MTNKSKHRWAETFHGKLTFWGVFNSYYEECSYGWNADTTKVSYQSAYENKILPNLKSHDYRSIDSYTKDDISNTINQIKKQGQGKPGEKFVPYDESTLEHFEFLIRRVFEVAASHYLCTSFFEPHHCDHRAQSGIKHSRLQRSFSCEQEKKIARFLLHHDISGQEAGLLLMWVFGLRNAEACGVNYGDIRPMDMHPEQMELWIYKTTQIGSNQLKASGKTRNADRIIPVPTKIAALLAKRKEWITSQLPTDYHIDSLPISCLDNDFGTRCSSRDLTNAAQILFQKLGISKEAMYNLRMEINHTDSSPEVPGDILEKSPTAYLYRRNFATHLALCMLDESEISYVLGHDIESPYESRNEFLNEDKRYKISQKMAQRPIVNDFPPICEVQIKPGTRVSLKPNEKYVITGNAERIRIHASGKEPADKIKLSIRSTPQYLYVHKETEISEKTQDLIERQIDIIEKYHEMYS